MALLNYACLLHNSLFTVVLLLLAPLATSTLLNPSLEPDLRCFPPELTPNKPTAHYCGLAIAGLPDSHVPRDYSLDSGSGRIIVNTALTSVGDPSSDLHLPRSSWSGDCRIDISMPAPAQVAHMLWDDVRQAARALVGRCVGNVAIRPPRPGPGGGGSAVLGPVLIAITHKPYAAQPGSEPSRPGFSAGQGFRIGAYYPPGSQA